MSTTISYGEVGRFRREKMMPKGLRYASGTVTLSSAASVTIQHNLGTSNVIVLLQHTDPSSQLGTFCQLSRLWIPSGMAMPSSALFLAIESRESSAVRTWITQEAAGQSSTATDTSVTMYATDRGWQYVFNGTYDYYIIALDKYSSSHMMPYRRMTGNVSVSGDDTFSVDNPFGTADAGFLGILLHKTPVPGQSQECWGSVMVKGLVSIDDSVESDALFGKAKESRTSLADSYYWYDSNYAALTNSTVTFSARNNNAPFALGDYDILMIKFPEFNYV